MKAKVELVYDDVTKNKQVEVVIKGAPKGLRLMNAVEKAVEKAMKNDQEWRRWNLLDIE